MNRVYKKQMHKRILLIAILPVLISLSTNPVHSGPTLASDIEEKGGCKVIEDPVYGKVCQGLCESDNKTKCTFDDDDNPTVCGAKCPTTTPTPTSTQTQTPFKKH